MPGGRLHWVERGEGRSVVMIHVLAGNLHNFTYAMTDRLAAAGYRRAGYPFHPREHRLRMTGAYAAHW